MLKALRWVLFAVVVYFFILPLLPAFRNAIGDLTRIDPVLLAVAIGLEFVALYCYTLLTHAALGPDANRLTRFDLFRIQLSTRALGSILPGGSAASNALGFRLITSSGISKADAGFALATAGIGSAVILNVLLWIGLVVSIPLRGSSPVYGTAAVAGAVLMAIVGAVVFGIVDDKGRLHRLVRWFFDKLGRDGESAASLIDHLRDRIRGLLAERDVLRRVIMWVARSPCTVAVPPGIRWKRVTRRALGGVRFGKRVGVGANHTGWSGHRGGHLHSDARGFWSPCGDGNRNGAHVPHCPVLVADHRRWCELRIAAYRRCDTRAHTAKPLGSTAVGCARRFPGK
jgi:hypothetical protein